MFSTSTKLRFANLAFVTLMVVGYSASAQVIRENIFELPLRNNENNFEIIPAKENGMFLLRNLTFDQSALSYQLVKLDTSLTISWQGRLAIPPKHIIAGKKAFGDYLYLLYRYQDFSANDFLLYRINENDGTFTQYRIRNFIPFSTLEFQASNDCVLIGGYFNRVPVVLHFSFHTGKSKVLPGLFNEVGELNQIQIYDDGSFDVLIKSKNFRKQQTIFIRTYTPEADLVRNFPLETEDKKHLVFARIVKSENTDFQLVAGVYGQRNSEYSSGIFITRIDLNGVQQTRYYPYGDLKNFFKYMRAKREQRIKNRIERKKIKGKKIRFNYRFLVHEIVPHKGQFVLLGEAFYPRYKSVERNPYLFSSGSPRMMNVHDGRIFDGYHYTHAVVIGFDPSGKINWDNSFEINDVRTFTLEQFVKMKPGKDEIALLYVYENKMRSKIIQGENVLEGKSINNITTDTETISYKGDISKLEYWYGKYLFTYGVQESGTGFRNRRSGKIFYVNKISVAD